MNDQTIMPLTPEQLAQDSTTVFGFWMYLMTDFVLFAALFAVYAVLRGNTLGGISASQVGDMPLVLTETLLLLTSSFTSGLALLAAGGGKRAGVLFWLCVTALLGAAFAFLEYAEFSRLISAGDGPSASGFLSSYFALVGTHGLHIVVGIAFALALVIAIARQGLTRSNLRKLMLWSLFWHFLEIVWIFIFTIVFLLPLV